MSEPQKIRIDSLMVEQGLTESRARAQAEVEAGNVLADGQPVKKAGQKVDPETKLTLKSEPFPWVSRAALKLIHGLDHFRFDVQGRTVLDLGASTGGFTEVALSRGAVHVYAVDVGHGQMVERLSQDPSVTILEGLNARDLSRDHLPDPFDFIVCDMSFISLTLGLGAALTLAAPGAQLIALIKPQFEVGKGNLAKGGLVKDEALRQKAVERVRTWLEGEAGWQVLGVSESPITGSDGNREYLIAAEKRT